MSSCREMGRNEHVPREMLTDSFGMSVATDPDMAAKKSEDLSEAVSHLLEECRMVLPGIQALFGFQLVAVFNQRFSQIPPSDQVIHLAAMIIVALSAALVMTPAAFHREVEPAQVSERMLMLSTRLLLASMILLAIGIAADLFVIAAIVLEHRMVSALIAIALFSILIALWFIFPYRQCR
jgi:hypothetical protein